MRKKNKKYIGRAKICIILYIFSAIFSIEKIYKI